MQLDPAGGIPLYLQIVDQFRAARLSGRYRPGDRIPPVRELALALRINPNTVAKAYRQLQAEGVLESRPGGGNFIASTPETALAAERQQRLHELLVFLLAETDSLHIPREQVLNALQYEIKQGEQQ